MCISCFANKMTRDSVLKLKMGPIKRNLPIFKAAQLKLFQWVLH